MMGLVRDSEGNVAFDDWDNIPRGWLSQMQPTDFDYCMSKMSNEGKEKAIRGDNDHQMMSMKVKYKFTALEDFWAPEVATQYIQGQTYSVREGNVKLHELVKTWQGQSKVEV